MTLILHSKSGEKYAHSFVQTTECSSVLCLWFDKKKSNNENNNKKYPLVTQSKRNKTCIQYSRQAKRKQNKRTEGEALQDFAESVCPRSCSVYYTVCAVLLESLLNHFKFYTINIQMLTDSEIWAKSSILFNYVLNHLLLKK